MSKLIFFFPTTILRALTNERRSAFERRVEGWERCFARLDLGEVVAWKSSWWRVVTLLGRERTTFDIFCKGRERTMVMGGEEEGC
jgi:hypothetical protein